MSLLDLQTLVTDMVRDDSGHINVGDIDEAIALAVKQYSKDRPLDKVEDIVSLGGHYLAMPSEWQMEYSSLKSLEYPIGSFPPEFIDVATYGLYNSPTGRQIMHDASLNSGESVRVTYTIQHTVDGVTDTTLSLDHEAISSWAASALCEQLATFYSGNQDNLITADSVNHSDLASRYSRRAKDNRKRYYNMMGIEPKRNKAAGVQVDFDMKNSRGNDRLTHPKRFR